MSRARTTGPAAQAAAAKALAVVLHDLAWLLPRTIDGDDDGGPDVLPLSELEVMRLLVRRPGLTVGEVARELGLQRTNASAAVRTLIGRGLLQRTRDEDDGRVARLTPAPRAIENRDRREAAWGVALTQRLELLDPGSAAEILACAPTLRSLADALSAGA